MSANRIVSVPARMRVVHSAGTMNVYRRQGYPKPYVVGCERNGGLVLLEEFEKLKPAKEWAGNNHGG